MRTYKEFKEAAILAAPLAAPVGKAIGAGLAATGLTGMIMQGRRKGENRKSQSVDYGQVFQASKEDKERRKQLAKDNNLDITKPGDRAKLGRLLKKDTEAKKRVKKGDTRSQEQYRQEKAENRKTIDATRQSMGQSKAKPGTKERAEIDKKLKDFRDELRDVTNDPIVPSTRAKVRVKVGQEVPKPNNTLPKRTGASPQKVRDRRSYEAQQRRNRKLNEGVPTLEVVHTEENKHRDAKLNYQYKEVTNPKRPVDVIKALKLKKV